MLNGRYMKLSTGVGQTGFPKSEVLGYHPLADSIMLCIINSRLFSSRPIKKPSQNVTISSSRIISGTRINSFGWPIFQVLLVT